MLILWISLAAVFLLLDLFKNYRVCLWLFLGSIGALVTNILGLDFILNPMTTEFSIFGVGIILSIFIPSLIRKARGENKPISNTDLMIGETIHLTKEATYLKPGEALIGDIEWSIVPKHLGQTLEEGTICKVVGFDGNRLVVIVASFKDRKRRRKIRREQIKNEKLSSLELKKEKVLAERKPKKEKLSRLFKNSDVQQEYRVPLTVCCIIFSLYAFSLAYPLFWILIKSIQNPVEFVFDAERFFPTSIYFGNYTRMIEEFDFVPMIINTIILSLIIPTMQIASMCCISYVYSKFRFKGRQLVFFIAIASMFIPSVGSLVASYEVMINLHLMNELYGYIIMCGSGMGFGFLLVSSQYDNVSKEYSEAAEMDGASRLRIFVQVVTPLILPTITALWVLSFIGTWNDYAGPYLFLPSHHTLAVGIKELQYIATISGGTDYPVLFAGIIMVEIPVLAMFFIFQKKILSFSLGGGIKG